MTFKPQAIFANLAEKEKIKGHHSPEGRAIRTLGRALHGWSTGILAARDVMVLCDQAIEDWLKARLKIASWSPRNVTELLATAVEKNLVTRLDAVRMERIHNLCARARGQNEDIAAQDVENALEFCIEIVEKHW